MAVVITDENTETTSGESAVEVAGAVADAITESVTEITGVIADAITEEKTETAVEINQWQTIQTELTEIKSTLSAIAQNQTLQLEMEAETLAEIETDETEIGTVEDDAPESMPEIPETQPEPEQQKQSFWKILF